MTAFDNFAADLAAIANALTRAAVTTVHERLVLDAASRGDEQGMRRAMQQMSTPDLQRLVARLES